MLCHLLQIPQTVSSGQLQQVNLSSCKASIIPTHHPTIEQMPHPPLVLPTFTLIAGSRPHFKVADVIFWSTLLQQLDVALKAVPVEQLKGVVLVDIINPA